MSFDYWFPWHPTRYRADTLSLTCEEDGIYRRLIDYYMETRLPIPDDIQAIERITNSSNRLAIAKVVPYFHKENDVLRLKRCDEILADQDARSAKRGKSGSLGGKKKALNNKKNLALA